MTDEEMIEDYPRLKREYTLLHEDYRRYDAMEKQQWIKATERLPNLIKGEDYSENVLAWCKGNLMVMCLCLVYDLDKKKYGYVWANCNGYIDGDCEFDHDYDVTHWMLFPGKPE